MATGPKQALYAEFASVARALGSQHRLEILEHLAQGERGVEALAERVGLSIANASTSAAIETSGTGHFAS